MRDQLSTGYFSCDVDDGFDLIHSFHRQGNDGLRSSGKSVMINQDGSSSAHCEPSSHKRVALKVGIILVRHQAVPST
jgi:hypothetical protein